MQVVGGGYVHSLSLNLSQCFSLPIYIYILVSKFYFTKKCARSYKNSQGHLPIYCTGFMLICIIVMNGNLFCGFTKNNSRLDSVDLRTKAGGRDYSVSLPFLTTHYCGVFTLSVGIHRNMWLRRDLRHHIAVSQGH